MLSTLKARVPLPPGFYIASLGKVTRATLKKSKYPLCLYLEPSPRIHKQGFDSRPQEKLCLARHDCGLKMGTEGTAPMITQGKRSNLGVTSLCDSCLFMGTENEIKHHPDSNFQVL